jgi:putative hydrolase of the HAD superfamily
MVFPRVIFFDVVGTLLHPEPSAPAVYESVGRRFGSQLDLATISARFRTAFRHQEAIDRAAGLHTSEEREIARWRAIVRETLDDVTDAEACFQELFAHFARPEAWRCAAGTDLVLNNLSERGYVLGLASNFDRRLRGLVDGMPALRHVRHLVVSSEIGWRKPATEFFAEVCRLADVPPGDILFVGDDYDNDYLGVRAAGLRALLLDPHRLRATERITFLEDLLYRFSE